MIIYRAPGHQEIRFSRASENDCMIGQNGRVIEVSFGLSENSLEAHLSKVKQRICVVVGVIIVTTRFGVKR